MLCLLLLVKQFNENIVHNIIRVLFLTRHDLFFMYVFRQSRSRFECLMRQQLTAHPSSHPLANLSPTHAKPLIFFTFTNFYSFVRTTQHTMNSQVRLLFFSFFKLKVTTCSIHFQLKTTTCSTPTHITILIYREAHTPLFLLQYIMVSLVV